MGLMIEPEISDRKRRQSAVEHLRAAKIALPTWRQLAEPTLMPVGTARRMTSVQPDAPDPLNLWRVHWFNDANRMDRVGVPGHVVLPPTLTSVKAPIVVVFGRRFPLISAHKVLAAYACLVARLATGGFDPANDRAIWPSTGNYCRGGVAISRILGCRGVAVLPAGMSAERFEWLAKWVNDPTDIVRTPGTESNVKEIYDKCAELARNIDNVVLNQFSEFANYLIHYQCTGAALDSVFMHLKKACPARRLKAFVSASGSAGTLAAGDRLKEKHNSLICAVEAVECPTMLNNGYGEHNIQGIGDKHIPLIHNVMNSNIVVGVSDRATDSLNLLFHNDAGRRYLTNRRKIDPAIVASFDDIGISGLANIVGAIKLAKHYDLDADDVLMTVATDSAALYESEHRAFLQRRYPDGFDEVNAAEIFSRYLEGAVDDHVLELTHTERNRIFNLGYYTWVEQQGVSIEDFERRRKQKFWQGLAAGLPAWDRIIDQFNAEVGVTPRD